ncbi:MAG: PAS domain S-box protein, partial [Candidatus Thermoplasmatota archaeon]|nr:PAS domain S-box protein [Candidatus Thermoplasmatota archaeon]
EELKLKKKDGTLIWASVTATAVYDENGEVKYYDGMIEDITERKEAEESLRSSQKKYQSLFEFQKGILKHSPTGILKLDERLRIVYENPEMKRLMGVPPGDESNAIGADIRELPSVKEAGLVEIFNNVLQGKEMYGESPFTSIYGKKTYLSFSVSPILEGGKFVGAVVIINDVTERKKVEESLKESEEKFRTLVNSAQDAIYSHDLEGNFLMWNPQGNRLSGYSDKELSGMNIADLLTPESLKIAREKTALKIKTKKPTPPYELSLVCKNGSIIPIEISSAPLIYEEKVVAVQGIARDITERKKVEEALKKAYEKVEEALKQEKVFKLKTAHHFFNPIAIAKGYLDLTMNEVPEEQKKKLQAAHHAIMRVEKVVKNVTQEGEIHE